jgi:hypothetical protein
METGDDGRPRGSADRGDGPHPSIPETPRGESIQMGRAGVRVPVTTEVRSGILAGQPEDVRPGRPVSSNPGRPENQAEAQQEPPSHGQS